MGNVQPITPHNTSVLAPAELRELQGWLIWRFEQDPDNPAHLVTVRGVGYRFEVD